MSVRATYAVVLALAALALIDLLAWDRPWLAAIALLAALVFWLGRGK